MSFGACLTVAAALAVAARGQGPSPFFDGSVGAEADMARFSIRGVMPLPKGRPAWPPEDLTAAGEVWGNEAQIAKLRAAHPGPKESFLFAVIGDAEPGRFPWQRIFAPGRAFPRQIGRIQGMKADFMVQLGDIVSKGTVRNYRALAEFLAAEVRIPLLTVIGNHDRSVPNGDGDKTLFKTLFRQTDYFLDYNGWRFIVLDTSDRRLAPEQVAWLEAALSPRRPTVVFTHVPPGYLRKRLSSPFSPESYNASGYFEEGSAEFRRLVADAGVKRVYMGHIHAFGTAELDGVRYVLTAGGGSPLYPLPPGYPKRKRPHFVGVEVGPWGLRETVYELDGTTFQLPQ